MRALLDTNVALWAAVSDARLTKRAKEFLETKDAELYLSVASLWELAIKTQIGKLTIPGTLEEFVARISKTQLRTLPIMPEHVLVVAKLPLLHKDPFDRILIAQSLSEAMPIMTSDHKISRYSVEVIW
jgi:PIN domain nuclease of toxin-antitoxin system